MRKGFEYMRKAAGSLFAAMTLVALTTGCAEQYSLRGTTNIHGMEGQTLYLKVFDSDNLKDMDSCRILHGKFQFKGNMDSVVMVNLFAGDQSLFPVVVEGGDVEVRINDGLCQISGSPLNDTLYNFIRQKTQIDNQIADLQRKEGRMVMDGMDHDQVVARLNAEYIDLSMRNDSLVTCFIKRNFDNVLGPGVFMIMTSGYPYPVLTPQIEELLVSATPYFVSHPYVSQYLKRAKENMEQLQYR